MTILNERPAASGYVVIKWLGYSLTVVAAVLIGLSIGRNSDAMTITLLLTPVVIFALLLLAPQAFVMVTRGKQVRTLNPLTGLPVLVMVGASFGAGVLDVRLALAPAGLCAAVTLLLGLGLAARRVPGNLAPALIFFALYGGAYGYGAMIFADTRLDHAEGQPFQSVVTQRYVSHGRSASYHLVLAPWGTLTGQDNVSVDWRLYDQTQLGETVCITLHPGLLRMPWRSVAACPRSLAPSSQSCGGALFVSQAAPRYRLGSVALPARVFGSSYRASHDPLRSFPRAGHFGAHERHVQERRRLMTLERAYALARSGQCPNVNQLKDRLKAEGCRAVDSILAARSIRGHLEAICAATFKASTSE